jgi:hypothetical protein
LCDSLKHGTKPAGLPDVDTGAGGAAGRKAEESGWKTNG